MSIQDELNQIKSAVYGADVRDAIHDGVEKGYNKAEQAESNSLDIKQTYDEILMNWESDPNKDPEVIAARGGLPQLEDRLNETDAQLAQIATDGAFYGVSTSNADNAPFIQAMLDRGGLVTITKPGNYVTSTLYIDDNTIFSLGKGVTLSLKSATDDYLIVNKGATENPKRRNKNIWIRGGKHNYNGQNNPISGAYLDGGYPGHGVFFHMVDGLKITDIEESGQAVKYAFMLANVTNLICDNVNFNNESDGFHIQPPFNNVKFSNITGYTGDNTFGFTIGDYRTFTVEENGNGENIVIENCHLGYPDKLVNEPIRFVGAGKDGTGYFKNIKIKNVTAYNQTNIPIVNILGQDQAAPNDYLNNTIIHNMEIENIDILNAMTTGFLVEVNIGSAIFNLKLNGLSIDPTLNQGIIFNMGAINNLILESISIVGQTNRVEPFIKMAIVGTVPNLVKNMVIRDSRFSLNSEDDFEFIKSANSTVENLFIENTVIQFNNSKGYLLDYTGATKNRVFINNSKLLNIKNKIRNDLELSISNTDCNFVSENIADLDNIGKLRVLASSSDFGFKVVNKGSQSTLSYNGTSATYRGTLDDLDPITNDVFLMRNGPYFGLYIRATTETFSLDRTQV